ncbi:MAG: hypothetical protein JO000_23535 [Alphaproteobacteria bacterium]|nr:hypothetical protein [Alphaproteobacteria bacterium]
MSLFGRIVRVPKALRGRDIAFRPTERNGMFDVLFRSQRISTLRVSAAAAPAAEARCAAFPRLAPEAVPGDGLLSPL